MTALFYCKFLIESEESMMKYDYIYNIGEESERRQAGEARESKRSGAVPRMKRGRRKKSEEQADVLIYFDYAGLGIQMRRYNV